MNNEEINNENQNKNESQNVNENSTINESSSVIENPILNESQNVNGIQTVSESPNMSDNSIVNETPTITEIPTTTGNQNVNDDMNNNKFQDDSSKKKKRNKVIIICLIIVLLIVVATLAILFFNKHSDNPSNNEETEEDEYYNYRIEKVGDDYTLMHNTNEVAKLNKEDKIKLYKDESDAKSKYIAVVYTNGEFFFGTSIPNTEYAYANALVDEENFTWNSILYNIKTGKSKTFDNALTTVVFGKFSNDPSKEYAALVQSGESVMGYDLISLKNLSPINKDDYLVIGDALLMSIDSPFISYNNKFVIIMDKKGEKHGLMDLKGKVLVDLKYNQMQTFENEDIIIVEENNKFGAINSSGKVLINFEYDGIDYKDGYFVVSKNNKLSVLDKNGKEIVPFSVELPDTCNGFRFQRDETANAFIIEQVDNNELVVAYLDKKTMKKSSNMLVCYNNYTYKYDYLVVSKDGQYKTYDTYKDYDENAWYE